MIASVDAKTLNNMIKKASALKPIFIALEAQGDKLIVFSLSKSFSGGLIELSQWTRADILEEGCWTVCNLKDFAPLKSLKKGCDVAIDAGDGKIGFTAPGFTFRANAVPGYQDGYLPEKFTGKADEAPSVSITEEDAPGYKHVSLALSDDTTRPEFTGALISNRAVVSTDGHRLHLYPKAGAGLTAITPPEMIKAIAAGACGKLTEREAANGKRWHVLEGDGYRMSAECITGQFPDFSRVIPAYPPERIASVNADELADALKTVSAGWKRSYVALRQDDDKVLITCCPFGKGGKGGKGSEGSEGVEPRSISISGSGFPASAARDGLDTRYLLDALAAWKGYAVNFCYIDAYTPVWLGHGDGRDGGMGAVVMPVVIM